MRPQPLSSRAASSARAKIRARKPAMSGSIGSLLLQRFGNWKLGAVDYRLIKYWRQSSGDSAVAGGWYPPSQFAESRACSEGAKMAGTTSRIMYRLSTNVGTGHP